jgi:predicted ABC-type ATPase
MSVQPPTIYVLAGPNGAGKTSLYGYEASGIPRLNGDTLYQQHQDLYEVEAALRQQQEEWVRQKRSFVIETNAASARDYALFKSLKAHGYRIELRYVGLKSVELCQERVTQRVAEGGHDVPPALIEQRYRNSLSLLKTNYQVFDHLQLYDNSETEPVELVDFLPGTLPRQLQPLPAWAAPVVAHFTRMEAVYGRLA